MHIREEKVMDSKKQEELKMLYGLVDQALASTDNGMYANIDDYERGFTHSLVEYLVNERSHNAKRFSTEQILELSWYDAERARIITQTVLDLYQFEGVYHRMIDTLETLRLKAAHAPRELAIT